MSSLRLRSYQQKVIEEVQYDNAIIKMPTGSGKTYVAAELILRCIEKNHNKKAIFFVPTVDLVDQQAKAIESWFANGETVARYHGNLSLPMMNMHRVLVSTPSAFLAAQPQNNQFHWKCFCICIFDEVHHLLKDHPYRKLSLKIMPFIQENETSMQIIGLSASLTYAVSDTSIQNALENLCTNLHITKMCTPSTEDLIAGGYTPKNNKVRDHCHLTGLYRGTACNKCNVNFNYKNYQIPVYFHNLKGFDGHLVVQGLKKMNFSNIEIIAQNFEKYMTFSFGNFRFLDSFAFLSSSLDTLASNLNPYHYNPKRKRKK